MPVRTEYAHGEFSWVDLVSHEMATVQSFYESVFGWTAEAMDTEGGPPYSQFTRNGNSVGGVGEMSQEMKDQGIPPMWNSYINVDNLEEIVTKALELGGTVTMPPMPVLDAGWLAFIQDPTGGNVGLWQKNKHHGAQQVTDPGFFCWNELATRDIEKAKEFYGELLGWEFVLSPDAPGEYYMIKCQGKDAGGMLQMTEEWGEIPPYWGVYFHVADLPGTVQSIKANGGSTMCEPFETPVGPMAVASDPQGAAFNVIQLRKAG